MITLMVRLDIEVSDLTDIMADLEDIADKYACQLVDYDGCVYDNTIPDEVSLKQLYHSDKKTENMK